MDNTILSELPVNQKAYVREILGGKVLIRRLMEMGITPGIEIIKTSTNWSGDVIKFRGYLVALRTSESKLIVVDLL